MSNYIYIYCYQNVYTKTWLSYSCAYYIHVYDNVTYWHITIAFGCVCVCVKYYHVRSAALLLLLLLLLLLYPKVGFAVRLTIIARSVCIQYTYIYIIYIHIHTICTVLSFECCKTKGGDGSGIVAKAVR